jgi:hypothetical protein
VGARLEQPQINIQSWKEVRATETLLESQKAIHPFDQWPLKVDLNTDVSCGSMMDRVKRLYRKFDVILTVHRR